MIECQNIEFKREFSDKISRTIVAFANTNGGRLFIGIDDNGEAIGVSAGVYPFFDRESAFHPDK